MRRLFLAIGFVQLALVIAVASWGADVSLGSGTAVPGGTVSLPLILTSEGDPIGGVADDIAYDESLLTPTGCTSSVVNTVSTHRQCSNAGPDVPGTACDADTDCAAPNVCNVLRVGLFSIPITTIPDGVVAECSFTVSPLAEPGTISLPSNPSTSTIDGVWVPTTDPPATITVLTRRQQLRACTAQRTAATKAATTAWKACKAQ